MTSTSKQHFEPFSIETYTQYALLTSTHTHPNRNWFCHWNHCNWHCRLNQSKSRKSLIFCFRWISHSLNCATENPLQKPKKKKQILLSITLQNFRSKNIKCYTQSADMSGQILKPLLHSYLAKNTIEFDTHPSIPPAVPSSSTVLSFLSFDAQPPIFIANFVFFYFINFLFGKFVFNLHTKEHTKSDWILFVMFVLASICFFSM